MSVAFRRDGDEEHLEPRFEIPIPPGPNWVTARGKALIDARVRDLAAQLAEAGDEAAQAAVKRDLRYWQTRQITAEEVAASSDESVQFGCTVTFLLNGQTRTLSIVGSDEAEGAADLLSFTAPLARALLGAEVGDVLPFSGRADAIEVTAIALSPAASARSSP
jgi:transcription elongation GreA/GreB family factor